MPPTRAMAPMIGGNGSVFLVSAHYGVLYSKVESALSSDDDLKKNPHVSFCRW